MSRPSGTPPPRRLQGRSWGAALTEPAPAVERRHTSGGPHPGRKKIAGVGSVYTVMPFMRTPHEGCESWFGTPPAEAFPTRPPSPCKRWRASRWREVKQSSPPAWDEVFGGMAQQGQGRPPEGRPPLVRVMDGQETVGEVGLKHLPEERFEVIEGLDLLPVTSYRWEAAHLFYPLGSAGALGGMKTAVGCVLGGQALTVVEDLRVRGRDLPSPRRKTLERSCAATSRGITTAWPTTSPGQRATPSPRGASKAPAVV
jgi:hypothetical protein